MIRHILLLQPKPETTPEQIEDCRKSLAALVGQIDGLLDFHWGENFAAPERQDGLSHGFSMDLVDRAALAAYAPHPQHKLAAVKVRDAFGRIVAFDFEL
jgi:hypothetical protein